MSLKIAVVEVGVVKFIYIYFQTVYPDESDVFPLFRLSFLWITPVGVSTVIIVGIITSFLTGKTDINTLDPDLISPVAQWLLPPQAQRYAGSAIRKARNQEIMENEAMVRLNFKVCVTFPIGMVSSTSKLSA